MRSEKTSKSMNRGTTAFTAGWFEAPTSWAVLAVYEVPIEPTWPSDQGCCATHATSPPRSFTSWGDQG